MIRLGRSALWGLVCAALATAASARVRFEHVTVIPMTGAPALRDAVVVTDGDRISYVGPASGAPRGRQAHTVDGRGRYLIPGLTDMHVHLEAGEMAPASAVRDELFVYLANGVTTVRNMGGSTWHLAIRKQLNEGTLLGPRMFTTGPILEEWPTASHLHPPTFHLLTSPEAATEEVSWEKRQGYDFIKVYNNFHPDVYRAVVAAAKAEQIPFLGHVPIEPGLRAAFANHQASIEHLRGYEMQVADNPTDTRVENRYGGWPRATDAQLNALARETVTAGAWNVPTLLITHTLERTPEVRAIGEDYPYLPAFLYRGMTTNYLTLIWSPEVIATIKAGLPRQRALVKALVDAGAPVMAGTDAMAPGISLHAELKFLRSSGITNYQTLETATSTPGRWFSRYSRASYRLGAVRVGNAADLVLLDADPLADIANIDRISGVMTRGRWLGRADLDARLKDLQTRNQALIAKMKSGAPPRSD